ncbi:MAG: glycosyltransferase family 2 protein [Holosporaceae bacterium]|nr:glycosyltransferase family 2 protein [Holosporaceae bacterium]
MKKLFCCLVVCLFIGQGTSACKPADFSGCVLVNLCTIYNNAKFTGDFVCSVSDAEYMVPFSVINIFRIDSGISDPIGRTDREALEGACRRFPLGKFEIINNESNIGCSGTRNMLLEKDLQRFVNEDPNVRRAAAEGKLFFQFLDTDDMVHPKLFHIEISVMLLNANCYALSCERDIRMFGRYSIERLEGMHRDCSPTDFSLVKRAKESPEKGVPFLPDGTMSDREPAQVFGYVPLCCKYDGGFFQRYSARFSPDWARVSLETMHNLMNLFENNAFILHPFKNMPSLYYYRQHPASALHSVKEFPGLWFFDKIRDDQHRRSVFVSFFVDCDLEKFGAEFDELKKERPDLGEFFTTILTEVTEERARLEKLSASLMHEMSVRAQTTFVPGLSW